MFAAAAVIIDGGGGGRGVPKPPGRRPWERDVRTASKDHPRGGLSITEGEKSPRIGEICCVLL